MWSFIEFVNFKKLINIAAMLRLLHFIKSKKNKSCFQAICKANNISINYKKNKKEIQLLTAIFERREYSDYFPFYRKVTILDIGAHCGYFSIFAAKNTAPDAVIIAIEPDTQNYSLLQENIEDCKIQNISTVQAAVSNTDSETYLYKSKSVNHSLIENYALNNTQSQKIKVESISPETLINQLGLNKIDFLKLDCEGSEYAILESKLLLSITHTISMEFHDLKDPNRTGETIVNQLKKSGFEIAKFSYEPTVAGLNYGKIIAIKKTE